MSCFEANTQIEIYVGDALFAAILENTVNDTHTILMDGRVRIGSAVKIGQSGRETTGRVQKCEPTEDGAGFRLIVVAASASQSWSRGFDWPTGGIPCLQPATAK